MVQMTRKISNNHNTKNNEDRDTRQCLVVLRLNFYYIRSSQWLFRITIGECRVLLYYVYSWVP